MHSACMQMTAAAPCTANRSCSVGIQTDRTFLDLRLSSRRYPAVVLRPSDALQQRHPLAVCRNRRVPLLLKARGAYSSLQHQATMAAAVTDEAIVTPERAWRRTERYSDKEWTTYQGWWTIYSGAGTGDGDVSREYHGIRCFRRAGIDGQQLLHKNLIAVNLGFGNPVQRPDGFWESDYTYSVDDPTYSCTTRPQPSEAGLQPHQIRRLTMATFNAYLASPAALPPADANTADGDAETRSRDTSGSGRSILPPGVWACEAFLEDGVHRWSLGAVYELPSRRLKTTFLIREYDMPVDPAAAHDPQRLPIPDARPGRGDPAAGADAQAGRACSAAEVRYGADGQLRQQTEGSAAAEPAENDGSRLLQYPDGMWARIPEQLPAAGGDNSGDVTFTWGGPMRGPLAYQQLQATYAADSGALVSLRSLAWQ